MSKLNIGCGENKKAGYVNLDWNDDFKPDVLADITKEWPFQDDYFEEITADFVFGLIHDSKDFRFALNECWRVLKDGGELIIKVPNALHPEDAFRDPMECRWFTPNTFDHFNYKHNRFINLKYGFKPWKIIAVYEDEYMRLRAIMSPYK